MDLINALIGAKLIKSPPFNFSRPNNSSIPTTKLPRTSPGTFMSEQSLETLNTENFATTSTTPITFGNESTTTMAPLSSDNASFASDPAVVTVTNLPKVSLSTDAPKESLSLASEIPIEPEMPDNLLANSPSNLHDPLNIDEHHMLGGTHLPGQEVNHEHIENQDSGSTKSPEMNKSNRKS